MMTGEGFLGNLHSYLGLALLSFTLSFLGTWALLPVLKRHVSDIPNERSNHKVPVPRGGGIAMIASALFCMHWAGLPFSIIGAASLLAFVSFIDDTRGLPVVARLGAQMLAVILALSAMHGRVLPSFVPLPLEYVVVALGWIWFINLTNFMDGIDGISACEAIMVSSGIALMHLPAPWIAPSLLAQAGIMAAAAYGFYWFNKNPARLFMGDVGSIPLGFLLGYMLLRLAAYGYGIAALILPAYYLADASLTLVKRLFAGKKIWQAHSEHAYQQAVRGGFTHAEVVARISWLNALLIGLALASTISMMAGVISLFAAYAITLLLLRHFTHATATPA